MNSKIFVQIAAYRDVQLLPTIRDCITTSKHPENLTFGICWQHDETESMEEFLNDPRFKIIDVPYQNSLGCCWARSKTQELYDGETYTMQIDSHMRFTEHWDELCLDMMGDLFNRGYKKPILTGYPPSFFPDKDPEQRMQWPIKVEFEKFFDQGVVNLTPHKLDGWEDMTSPAPAKYFSAGFAFTLGSFCEEIPYDPELFFRGEEITMSVRSYTNGYDFFHPHRIIVWHEYTRPTAPKNHIPEAMKKAHHRTEVFLGIIEDEDINFGIYGIGRERSLEDYEKLIGINFKTKNIIKL